MENVSIVCVGDSTIDRFFRLDEGEAELLCRHNDCEIAFKYGEKVLVEKYHKSFGGSAINTSLGFARMSATVFVSTIVGDDTDGNDICSFLSQNKVAIDSVVKQGETNQSAILVYRNERTIFSYHKERNYGLLNIPQTNWLYLCSAGNGFEQVISKIKQLLDAGVKLAINPGSAELKNFDSLKEILKAAEVLFLNRQEAELVFQKDNIGQILNEIIGIGTKIAVITDGANGAYIASASEKFHMGIAPSTLVDSTGAGDAFACAFTGALMSGLSLEESARWGMVNSASVIGKIGANEGLLGSDELRRRAGEAAILKPSQI